MADLIVAVHEHPSMDEARAAWRRVQGWPKPQGQTPFGCLAMLCVEHKTPVVVLVVSDDVTLEALRPLLGGTPTKDSCREDMARVAVEKHLGAAARGKDVAREGCNDLVVLPEAEERRGH